MADYVFEIRLWGMGWDEADELADEIADLLAGRGLATDPDKGDQQHVRSVISIKPTKGLDCSDRDRLFAVMRKAARGSRRMVIPSNGAHRVKEPPRDRP